MHPVLFSFGPVHLYSYGFLVAIGVLCAILFLKSHASYIAVDSDTIIDLAVTTVLSGFAGARIYYVIQFWEHFSTDPLSVIKIWEGGIVLYGGLIGGVIGFSIFIFIKKLPLWSLLDLFVIATSIAQGFGRLGCFLNGCCYGRETNLPWGVKFPFSESVLHPTQLYESLFSFLLAGFLYLFWKRNRNKIGLTSIAYFILYPIGRFVIEFFRGDQAKIFLNLSLAQWVSIGFICATSLIAIIYGKKNNNRSA